jgi:ketosteroid isomerase-like protein
VSETADSSSFDQFLRERESAAEAYVNGDAGPVEEITTGESPATFFGPDGSAITGPDEIRTAFSRGAQMFTEGGQSRLEVLQADASGDVAFWCGIQHATVRMAADGSTTEMPLRITEVFRREGSDWRLVHRHADALSDDAPDRRAE